MTDQEQTPEDLQPYYIAPETEKAVLGALLLRSDMLPIVRAELAGVAAPFRCTVNPIGGTNAEIFQIICELSDTIGSYHLRQVRERIKIKRNLDAANERLVFEQLCDMQEVACFDYQLQGHCSQLKDFATRREALVAVQDIKGFLPHVSSATELITKTCTRLGELVAHAIKPKKSFAESLSEAILRLSDGKDDESLPLGFADLDDIINGIRPGELVLIGARPSMGKTMFATNTAINMAKHVCNRVKLREEANTKELAEAAKEEREPKPPQSLVPTPVLFFSLEMRKEELGCKMISSMAQVNARQLRNNPLFTSDEWARVYCAKLEIEELWLEVYDATDSIQTVAEIEAKIASYIVKGQTPAAVIIDYVQRLTGDTAGKGHNDRNRELEQISRGLQRIAKITGTRILALSQLSREVEKRFNKRPEMSDLRDCGSLEQDADIIAFLYRDKYYNPDTEDGEVVEVSVKKHRQGEIGTAVLDYVPWCQTLLSSGRRAEDLPSRSKKEQPRKSRYKKDSGALSVVPES